MESKDKRTLLQKPADPFLALKNKTFAAKILNLRIRAKAMALTLRSPICGWQLLLSPY